MIAKLKLEIQELKNQLALVSGDQSTEDLSRAELDRLQERVQEYLQDQDPESQLNVGADMRKINECFRILKVHDVITKVNHVTVSGKKCHCPLLLQWRGKKCSLSVAWHLFQWLLLWLQMLIINQTSFQTLFLAYCAPLTTRTSWILFDACIGAKNLVMYLETSSCSLN